MSIRLQEAIEDAIEKLEIGSSAAKRDGREGIALLLRMAADELKEAAAEGQSATSPSE